MLYRSADWLALMVTYIVVLQVYVVGLAVQVVPTVEPAGSSAVRTGRMQ